MGYYGSGHFYNGIFVGMGPWTGWGYGHGSGSHRFVSDGGGVACTGFAGSGNLYLDSTGSGNASAPRGGGASQGDTEHK
jgi:hypothetical protein